MGTEDFEFDDLFGDDDEDLGEGFESDEKESGFGFDDEEEDYDLEDFEDFDEELDEDFLGEGEEFEEVGAAAGPSRTFVIIAMGMMVVFIVAIILVMVLVLGQDEGPSANELTAHAIETENAGTEAAFYATKTQEPIDATATAEEAARVIQLQMTEESIQMTEAAQESATAQFFFDQQTQTAAAETPEVEVTPTVDELARLQTAQALTETAAVETPEETAFVQPTISVDGVAATATAIAAALQTPIILTTPTELPRGDRFTPVPTARATALPDSGMFDDVGGDTGVALVLLAAFGLVGVIFGTRTLRTINRRSQ